MEAEADEEERIMKREAEALSEVADVKGAISLCGKFTDEVKELERLKEERGPKPPPQPVPKLVPTPVPVAQLEPNFPLLHLTP